MNEYCLNFLAHSVAGHKVRTCLYLQSKERSGKGVILNLFKSMLRDRMCKTSSAETVVKYTKPFEGCCLVNLDEVPVQGSYKDYQDKLKSLITEPKFQSRAMYQMGIERPNTFNIILTTNNDAVSLTTTNHERYVMPDVSNHRIGDYDYFNKLTDTMKKPLFKEAYYKFLWKRYEDTKHFNFDKKPTSNTRSKTPTIICL